MKETIASVLLLLSVAACRDLDVVTASYNTLSEAREAGAVAGGRLPEGLPAGATDLREAYSAGSKTRWGLFSFPVGEASQLKGILASEVSLAGKNCSPPRRIEWWPILLRGALDPERIAAAGLKAYRSTDDSLIILVNWNQGRAYYCTAVR